MTAKRLSLEQILGREAIERHSIILGNYPNSFALLPKPVVAVADWEATAAEVLQTHEVGMSKFLAAMETDVQNAKRGSHAADSSIPQHASRTESRYSDGGEDARPKEPPTLRRV